ncbi:Ig-like domain-containing protein [Vibrio natriegens]|uniref:Ig-like domain-containing protein n=1 Tax=Vibrio natriegens TaxID=691 RepID=UPI00355766D6
MWLSFYAGMKFNFQNETDLKILRMFNILYNSKILATNAFKFSITTLFGASALLFTASAVSQDDTYGIGLDANHHHSYAQKAKNIASEKRQNAQANTKALMNAMAAYQNATKSEKSNNLNKMISLAEERQQLLTELVKSSPASVASVAITTEEQQGMPKEVKKLLEQEQVLEGELEVFYEDYEDHSKSRLHHVLKTADGSVEVHTDNVNIKSLQSGLKVRARGWKFAGSEESTESLVLGDEQDTLTVLAQDSTGTSSETSVSSTALSNTFGEQRTLVLLVNFQDNTAQPWTVEETRDMVFGQVNEFYKENSFGQTWLSGDVHDYNTLPIDTTTCNSSDIYRYGRLAAEEDGVDLSQYSRLVFLFPEISSCGWIGKGTLGGSQSRAWINGSFTVNTIGHELGHNFGVHHAKQLDCGADVIGDNCVSITYGDTMDIMGKDGVEGHFSAHNKELLGWLGSNSNEIVTVETDGSYLLEPYESVPNGTAKSLKIKRGTDPETGATLWYYLEYRQPLGFDSFLDGKEGITNGIVFRIATGDDILSNELLDMTPSSAFRDMEDSSLAVGSSYTDVEAGITITTEWADSSGASVHVSFSQSTCTTTAPGIIVSPIDNSAAAGNTVSYDVTVTNNDTEGCSAVDYSISANALSGWSTTESTVNLEPGASTTTTVNVTSPETADAGVYDVTFTAMNNAQSEYKNSTNSSYIVETLVEECVPASPLLSLSQSQSGDVEPGSSVIYTATITSQDSSSCEAANFEVVANVPDGWSGESSLVALSPGESTSVDLSVTSSDDAISGTYLFDVYTYHADNMGYNATKEATYTIIEPAQVCEPSAPLISVSSNGGEVEAGSAINYSVTVTNQNSTDCEEKSYVLSAEMPEGWSSTSSNITLNSGDSATINLSVVSAATAVDGTYGILIRAQDTTDSQIISSSTVEYVIVNPVNSAPVAVNDSVTLTTKEPTLINVLSNDSDPEGDDLTIQAVTQGSKGSVEITTDGKLLYTPAKNFKGSDSFTYTVSDGNLTTTASVTVVFNSTTGSNTNKGKGNK